MSRWTWNDVPTPKRVPDVALPPEAVAARREREQSAPEHYERWRSLKDAGDVYGAARYMRDHEDVILSVLESRRAAARDANIPERDPAIVQRERENDAALLREYRAMKHENPVKAAYFYNDFEHAIRRATQAEKESSET